MPGLIEGYSYDIFVSYRQKDNKGDRWVTDFVEALKIELESTFKEEISVYFDVNPHDGLLETHDVDASLKEKLNCLVFIPILSHTYCDPKSFAWEHEFKVFIELASRDKFGLKIKGQSGNVTSRVLPIQIHELEAEDKKIIENVLCGYLRGIDFIYKEPGVNRPLTKDDDEKRNLNNTIYRNQINKVANAVKETITALKSSQLKNLAPVEAVEDKTLNYKKNKFKIIKGSFVLIAFLLIAYFVIILSKQPERSIAVLPFENWNSDQEYSYLGDAITDEIILQFQNMNIFDRVLSRSSTMQFKENRPAIPEIGKKLDVNYIIEGSIQRHKDNLIINVQLIRAKHEDHIWGNKYNDKWDEILNIQNDIAIKIAEELKIVLPALDLKKFKKKPTENSEAYNLYLKGRYFWNFRTESTLLKAIDCFNEAISIDPTYALAYTGLADSYIMLPWYGSPKFDAYYKAEEAAKKSLELNNTLGETYATMGFINYSKWNFKSARADFIKAIDLNPSYPNAHLWYAMLLACTAQFEEAIDEILIARRLDPLGLVINRNAGFIYTSAKQYNKGIEALKKAVELDSTFISVHHHLAQVYLNCEMYDDALRECNLSREKILLGNVYAHMGEMEKARQVLSEIILSSESQYVSPFDLALLYLSLGDEDQGIGYLSKAYDVHDLKLTEIRMYPELDKYLVNPAFEGLLKKMGVND